MTDEPLTWDNIPGLTEEERRAARNNMGVVDLRFMTLEACVFDGIELPPIVNGVVIR